MEKIKFNKEKSLGEAISVAINKINEIIDYLDNNCKSIVNKPVCNCKEVSSKTEPTNLTKEEIMEEVEREFPKGEYYHRQLFIDWLSNILDKLNVK